MDLSQIAGLKRIQAITCNVGTRGGPCYWDDVQLVVKKAPTTAYEPYYVEDHLGSIRAVVAGDGSVEETRDYCPYGLHMAVVHVEKHVNAQGLHRIWME